MERHTIREHWLTVLAFLFILLFLIATPLAACAPQPWKQDPDVQTAQRDCASLADEKRYACIERHAVDRLNLDVCRLAGMWVDDMCLQAVYQAANDPAICARLYLEGVRPTCRTYYASLEVATTPSPTAPLQLTSTQWVPPSPTSTASPQPTPTLGIRVTPSVAAGLTIEEYPVIAADLATPDRMEFLGYVDPAILARREDWRKPVHRCVPGLYDCPPLIINGQDYAVEMVDVFHYNVRQNGTIVYSLTAAHSPPDPPAHIALLEWQGQWVLEFDNQVIVNGVNLNQQLGYDKIFNWRLLHGQPFYFFEQDGRVHVSYGGQTLSQTYDEVVHNQCCEPALFNVVTCADMVAFYARQDNTWFYVEMGVYDE